MRFVPIKNVEQQSVLAQHRVRQGFVKARTAQANQIELSKWSPGGGLAGIGAPPAFQRWPAKPVGHQ